jgi:hypothetical protein
MYQTYHSWIHPLHYSPLSPYLPIPGVVSTSIIFPFTFMWTLYLHHIFIYMLKTWQVTALDPVRIASPCSWSPYVPQCHLVLYGGLWNHVLKLKLNTNSWSSTCLQWNILVEILCCSSRKLILQLIIDTCNRDEKIQVYHVFWDTYISGTVEQTKLIIQARTLPTLKMLCFIIFL